MENKNKSKKGMIKVAIFGGLVGGVMGLFLAPKSGQELRQDLAEQANKMGDKAVEIKNMAQSACQNIEDKTQLTVSTGKSCINKGKQMVSNLKILVYEIQHGALTKTVSICASEDMDSIEPTKEIRIIENEHEY